MATPVHGELGYDISGPSLLRMDNQSAIAVSKNPHPSFPLTTTTGHRVMATPPPVPTDSTAKAPKLKPSPPSAEALCLKTFRACWYLNKDWLVSFVTSAQCAKPDAPINPFTFTHTPAVSTPSFFFFFFLHSPVAFRELHGRFLSTHRSPTVLYVEQSPT